MPSSRSILVLVASLVVLVGCAHSSGGESTAPIVATTPTLEGRETSPLVTDVPPAPPVEALPPPQPIDSPPVRPCEAVIARVDAEDGAECVSLERVQPEGRPLAACVATESTQRFLFDAQGRIVEAPDATYAHRAHGAATRTSGRTRTALVFDAQGLVTREGHDTNTYDERGRLTRTESGRHFLNYVYAPDDTYTTNHNYPDTDEFCVSERVEVGRDASGRVAFDRYDGCQINEVTRTLRYTYDTEGQLIRIDVDLRSDGSIDGTVTLRYSC